jgi:hypothetical protein
MPAVPIGQETSSCPTNSARPKTTKGEVGVTAYQIWTLIIAGAGVLVAGAAAMMLHLRSKQQHKTQIRPFVTAAAEMAPTQGYLIPLCVVLRNAGPGVAFEVETDLQAAWSSGHLEPVRDVLAELMPGDPKVIRAGPLGYTAVWGIIVYRDAEKRQYWSACTKGSPRWDRGEGAAPAGYVRAQVSA